MKRRELRVLVVEDDADDYELARLVLDEIETFACLVERAASYKSAKEKLAEIEFGVCLIDYRLGERD